MILFTSNESDIDWRKLTEENLKIRDKYWFLSFEAVRIL